MSFNISPDSALGWFKTIKRYFKDFKPEAKSMNINFSQKTCSIGLALKTDEGFRKNHSKIKIPAYPGFRIQSMQDASFNRIQSLWKNIKREWVLDAKDLPPSDGYFVEMVGSIDTKSLDGLVHIKPSFNRDSNDEVDRYWLDASIKDPKKLEEIWTELQIDEVDVGVKIDTNKLFGLRLPQEIKDKADSIQKYLDAGKQGDRGLLFNTMHDYRRQERKTPFHPIDFLRVIETLTARDTILEYLSVDERYDIGDVEHPNSYEGIVPQEVKVQTLTRLTLKDPQSMGYLTLRRKKYLEKIKEEFDIIVKKK